MGGCYGTSHFFQAPQITSTNILESCTVSKRDAVMIPLLNACVNKLRDQGMKQMFLDAVTEHVESYERLGECLNYRSNHLGPNCVHRLQEVGKIQGRLAGSMKQPY